MIWKKYSESAPNIVYFSFLLIALSLPFSIKANSICIITSLVAVIACHCSLKKKIEITHPYLFWASVALFGLHILSLTYSADVKQGTFEVEKKLSLLIFPLMILTQKEISFLWLKRILLGFSLSTIVFLLIHLVRLYYHDPLERLFFVEENGFNLRRAFDMYYEIHPTYLSLYLLFSGFILLSFLTKSQSILIKAALVAGTLICFGFVFALGSRIIIFCMLLLVPVYIFKRLKTSKLETALIITVLAGVLFIAYQLTPSVKNRFTEFIETESKPPLTKEEMNSTNIRVAVWECTKQIIDFKTFCIGLGIGDVQNSMDDCFRGKNWAKELYESKYNLHNQYFQTLAGVGIAGTLLLLFIYSYCFYVGIRTNNYLLIGLVLIIAVCCITETVLGTQKGTVFFFFLANLLCLSSSKPSKALIPGDKFPDF